MPTVETPPDETSCRGRPSMITIRAGSWQNGFFVDFYFWAAGFLRGFFRRIFSPDFFLGGTSAERSWHEQFFSRHELSHEKCSEISPEKFEPLFVVPKESGKIPAKFPYPKSPPNHRRASARVQGEDSSPFCGTKCPEKSSRKIPAKSSKIYSEKSPTHFCRGARPILKMNWACR